MRNVVERRGAAEVPENTALSGSRQDQQQLLTLNVCANVACTLICTTTHTHTVAAAAAVVAAARLQSSRVIRAFKADREAAVIDRRVVTPV